MAPGPTRGSRAAGPPLTLAFRTIVNGHEAGYTSTVVLITDTATLGAAASRGSLRRMSSSRVVRSSSIYAIMTTPKKILTPFSILHGSPAIRVVCVLVDTGASAGFRPSPDLLS